MFTFVLQQIFRLSSGNTAVKPAENKPSQYTTHLNKEILFCISDL